MGVREGRSEIHVREVVEREEQEGAVRDGESRRKEGDASFVNRRRARNRIEHRERARDGQPFQVRPVRRSCDCSKKVRCVPTRHRGQRVRRRSGSC